MKRSTPPLALQPPAASIPMRLVRLSDASALHQCCWPERTFDSVYRFVSRVRYNVSQGRAVAVVVPDGELVKAFGQFTRWPRCGEISDLFVAGNYRGQGIGTAMIQYLVRAAHDMQAECVDIGAAFSNPRALALYRRLGFLDSYVQELDLGKGAEPVQYLRLKF